MDNNHQKFDSQSIANRVRELFLHYGIGKRQHARELSRILGAPQKTESMVTPVFATPILTISWLA